MAPSATPFTDIGADDWIDRYMPARLRPYLRLARLDRPIGTWLLLFPGWWAIALAIPETDDWTKAAYLAALFGIGAVVMRSAGCVVNDILDRKMDAQVERTRGRPIAAGVISVRQALIFLAGLLAIGLAILVQMNGLTIALGVGSLILIGVYPLMKRVTWWPQAFLGITFNWGALIGWTAMTGSLDLPALILYAGGIAWTIGYDTIYAHQDKEDDALVGVKSTARLFGTATKKWLIVFYALATVIFSTSVYTADLSWPAYLGIGAVALHFAWQIGRVDINAPADCLIKFKSNRFVGWLLLAGLLAGAAYS